MSADYPAAQEHFVPRSFMFNSNNPVSIVIHKTGGDATPQDVYNTFINSGNPGKSSHYAIGTDGTIWQFVPESLGAGANCCAEAGYDPFWTQYVDAYGNLNLCTISIEHCDAALDNATPLTPAQKAASFALVASLAKKYGIPASHIKTHASIDPQSRARCPGNYPMDELLAYIQNGGNTTDMLDINNPWVAGYFIQTASNPDRWHCAKTGHDLFAGILAGWRTMNGAPRLPVGPETPCGKSAVYQQCESGIVLYDPAHELDAPRGPWEPCYLLKLESDLAKQLLGAAQPAPAIDNTALIAAINAIPDAIVPAVAAALVEAKKL